jgi:hypothetical protein
MIKLAIGILLLLSAVSAHAQATVMVTLSPEGAEAFAYQVDAANADPETPQMTVESYVQMRLDAVQASVVQEVALARAATVQRAVSNSTPELRDAMTQVAMIAGGTGLTPDQVRVLQRAFSEVLSPSAAAPAPSPAPQPAPEPEPAPAPSPGPVPILPPVR